MRKITSYWTRSIGCPTCRGDPIHSKIIKYLLHQRNYAVVSISNIDQKLFCYFPDDLIGVRDAMTSVFRDVFHGKYDKLPLYFIGSSNGAKFASVLFQKLLKDETFSGRVSGLIQINAIPYTYPCNGTEGNAVMSGGSVRYNLPIALINMANSPLSPHFGNKGLPSWYFDTENWEGCGQADLRGFVKKEFVALPTPLTPQLFDQYRVRTLNSDQLKTLFNKLKLRGIVDNSTDVLLVDPRTNKFSRTWKGIATSLFPEIFPSQDSLKENQSPFSDIMSLAFGAHSNTEAHLADALDWIMRINELLSFRKQHFQFKDPKWFIGKVLDSKKTWVKGNSEGGHRVETSDNLCITFVSSSDRDREIIRKNARHIPCDWAVVLHTVYGNMTYGMEPLLPICNADGAVGDGPRLVYCKMSILSMDDVKFITSVRPLVTQKNVTTVVTKPSMYRQVRHLLGAYRNVFLFDGDISFERYDFTKGLVAWKHGYRNAPLVVAPLLYNNPGVKYWGPNNEAFWSNRSGVSMLNASCISQQVSFHDAGFLDWYFLHILRYTEPFHVHYSSNCGVDHLWCSSADYYAKNILKVVDSNYHSCGILADSRSYAIHLNTQTLAFHKYRKGNMHLAKVYCRRSGLAYLAGYASLFHKIHSNCSDPEYLLSVGDLIGI